MTLLSCIDHSTALLVSVSLDPHHVHLALSGDLDIATAPQLQQTVTAALRQEGTGSVPAGCGVVRMDLSAVDFVDAAGLGALVEAHHSVETAGGHLVLTGVRPLPLRLMEVTGLLALLDVTGQTGVPTAQPSPVDRR